VAGGEGQGCGPAGGPARQSIVDFGLPVSSVLRYALQVRRGSDKVENVSALKFFCLGTFQVLAVSNLEVTDIRFEAGHV
jgi:hypothetical protein